MFDSFLSLLSLRARNFRLRPAIDDTISHLLPAGLLESETIRERSRAVKNLENIARLRLPTDLFRTLVAQIEIELPTLSDADMAINNLDRFF
ncbi:MAG: hypothetical protein GY904_15845, partial [Planctomycetaceae bacterium]|nr:hypothetical protein [Planctomycetaceae bacterium]